MLSFIIVDYKSYLNTIEYINMLIKSVKELEISFVIVDNSVDEENFEGFLNYFTEKKRVDDIQEEVYLINYKNIKVLICKNSINAGYAKGNNLGFLLAKNLFNPKYIIFSNNDIKINTNKFDLEKCIKIFEEDKMAAALGPAIKGLDGKNQTPCKEMNIYERWIRFLWLYPLSKIIKRFSCNDLIEVKNKQYVFRVMGSFILFKSDQFEKIGQFDPKTFLFAEELIIAQKIKRQNLKTIYYPEIEIIHAHGETIDKSIKKYKKLKMRFDSEMYYYKNYCGANNIQIIIAKLGLGVYIIKDFIYEKLKRLRGNS